MMERPRLVAWLMALALTAPLTATAQPGGATAAFTPEQLEQVAAPVALYPDPLLAQLLMASTYPLEVVQAARFVKDNPNLKGAQLNEKLKEQTWDDSVKSLVEFPEVLTLMDQKLDWVQKLGDAFLGQQKELLDAVQRLRARAQAQGNLKSTPQQTVTVEPAAPTAAPPPGPGQPPPPQPVVVQQQPATVITIEPTNPQVVYVPTYNPTVVYGAWPYPAYPPYYYYPPGYVAGAALLSFGIGMAVGGALWGNCNWGHGDVNVNVNQYNSYSRNVNNVDVANRRTDIQNNRGNGQWQHNPEHRKGAQYRDASTQQRFNKAATPNAQSREAFRGRAAEGRQEMARGGMQQGSVAGRQGAQAPVAGRGQAQQLGGGNVGQARAPGAFEGVGQGRAVSTDSARGRTSRESVGSSTAGRGGHGRKASGWLFQFLRSSPRKGSNRFRSSCACGGPLSPRPGSSRARFCWPGLSAARPAVVP